MDFVKLIRLHGRRTLDSNFCKKWAAIERFGGINPWHIFTAFLDENSVIYSAGVGRDISFEKALISRFDVNIELFDPSPTGVATMTLDENISPKIHFAPVGLAAVSGVEKFSPPGDESDGSFSVNLKRDCFVELPCKDLRCLMNERGHSYIDLLKMDIEGFEYQVIDYILENAIDVRQICVEFHHFMKEINIFWTLRAIQRLRRYGYKIINKSRFDYTFLRENLLK